MTDSRGDGSRRETTAGDRATEAFAILGNETRLSILLALWEAVEPFDDENAVPFETLREQVGVDDESQFGYHLQKLTDRYVQESDDGYELKHAGRQIVQTIIAGAGIEAPAFEPTELEDDECPHCGAPVAVTYRDGWLCLVCTSCEGRFGGRKDMPDGMLTGGAFPPAGVADRSPAEMFAAHDTQKNLAFLAAAEGVCDQCTGPMAGALERCEDHTSEGTCETCGRRRRVTARFRCPICKNHHGISPGHLVWSHPAVISFAYEHDVTYLYEDNESGVETDVEERIEEDPLRVVVTIRLAGDELQVTLDETLDVVEVHQPAT